jgi:hypothetical protein
VRVRLLTVVLFIGAFPFAGQAFAAPRADGQLQIEIIDGDTGQPIAARMHLRNSRKRPARLKLPNTAAYADHFYIDGQLSLPLARGQYTFELDAGPEYLTQSGHFEIERHADDSKQIEMKRFVNLAEEGWYGGDVDVTRPARDMPLILRAEGLHDIRKPESVTIARTPYAWKVPSQLASDTLDAVGLIHHHSLRNGVVDNEEDGLPRDRSMFPGRTGNGRWSQAVYYHMLNCGFRIPPVAGSGSGSNDNPVGQNRVYVHCGDAFSPERWWEGLVAGRVFVTNGPLLRPMVEGHPPGHVFHIDGSGSLTLEIGLSLATRVPVEYLEIIKNGEVEVDVRLSDWKKEKGRLPPITFDDSGWFLVRAVTANRETYEFASTGPYYVEKSGQARISRSSVQFFLDWIDAADARLRSLPKLDHATRESLLAEQALAHAFFEDLLSRANAD